MRWSMLFVGVVFWLLATPHAEAQGGGGGTVDLPRYPAMSPDGARLTFSWRGDLWVVDAGGGQAQRLTSHPNNDTLSTWSPDGQWIAFNSTRDGGDNIFLMRPDGSDVHRITDTDRSLNLSGWSADGRWVLFDASMEGDVYRGVRPYRVSVEGGPIERINGAFGAHPVESADGRRVALTRGGSSWTRRGYRGPADRDVWVYDASGDRFRRVTDWDGNDGKAHWVGGDDLLYVSDRYENTWNLFRKSAGDNVSAAGRRLTNFKGQGVLEVDTAWDGSAAVFTVWDTIYTLDLRSPGSEPIAITVTAPQDAGDAVELKNVSGEVSEAALSPDGEVLAVVAYGELFVRNVKDGSPTRRVTDTHARERDIAWSPDGMKLYFVSDTDGTESIYAATVELTRGELKERFAEAIAPPEEEEPEEGDPEEADAGDADDEADAGEDEGEDSGDTDEGDEEEDSKDEDKKKEPKDNPADRWHDAIRFTIEPVVQSASNDHAPMPSPDGSKLAFRRTRGDLMILDLESGEATPLVQTWDQWMDIAWSPDGLMMAVAHQDRDFNADVWIMPIDGSWDAVNISRHPDNDWGPQWSGDGKVLAFQSERINEEYDIWMVFLDEDLEAMTPQERDAYFEEAGKAAKKRKPLKPKVDEAEDDGSDEDDGEDEADEPAVAGEGLELDDAYLRLRRVTSMNGSEGDLRVTPAGDRMIFSGTGDDGRGVYLIKWDGSESKRLRGGADLQHLSLDGSKLVYISGGRAGTMGVDGGKAETINISATMEIDLAAQSSQKFWEASRILGDTFYHPTMKDLDWPALTEQYHEAVSRAHTPDEFGYFAGRFIGELNASHLGIRPPGEDRENDLSFGRLGVDTEPTDGGFVVTRVLSNGPADKGEMALKPGDVIVGIELEPVEPGDTLGGLLKGRIGDETIVTVRRSIEAAPDPVDLDLLITPISYGAEAGLRYNQWQLDKAAMVDEWSGGRIGYLHIRSMNQSSLYEFERDLFAAVDGKDGLLIDVRNNGGGSTADRVIASLAVTPHAYTVPRGADPSHTDGYPQDRLFIQRYTRPTNMLCNENSFSNAEIVSHAFKAIGRGNLVGQQTYGGVISTGGTRLIDGTFVRLPFRGWYLMDGTDMENNGAMPDIVVEQTPEDEQRGFDAQLRAAVDDLVERLP